MMGEYMYNIVDVLADIVLSQLNGTVCDKLPDDLNVDELTDIALQNQIDSLVIKALMGCGAIDSDNSYYKQRVINCFIRSSTQMNTLKELQAIFENQKIKNHPMKGAILKKYYPSDDMRQMSDLDILVEMKDLTRVNEILISKGYKLIQRESHHDIYKKEPFMFIEVHHALYDVMVDKEQYEYFGTFRRSKKVNHYSYAYEFSNEDFYVYMMAHMAKHFYKRGCGVRNLIDVYVFLEKFKDKINRTYIDEQLEINGLIVYAKHMEKAAYLWLEKKERSEFYNDLVNYMVDSGVYGKDENGIWNKFANEYSTNNKTSKSKLKTWYFFPPVYYMTEYYPWLENRKWLLPIAWLVRGINGLLGHKGKNKRALLKHVEVDEINTIQKIYKEMQLEFHKK